MQRTTGRLRCTAVILFSLFINIFLFAAPTGRSATNAAKKGDRLLKGVGKEMGSLSRTATDRNDTPGGVGTFIETMLILALFVGGLYMLFRFIQKKKGTSVSGETAIKVLSSRSAGGNRMLQIVEVGNQVFFIGVGDGSINLISEISDKETVDWLRMEYTKGPESGSTGFLEKLFNMLGRSGEGKPDRQTKMDFLKEQRSRLKKMDDK